jgi:hypothetical protein
MSGSDISLKQNIGFPHETPSNIHSDSFWAKSRSVETKQRYDVTWSSRCFSDAGKGDFGHSSRFETVVVLFTKAVQFMNFPKSLSAMFIGSTAVLCTLDKYTMPHFLPGL